MESETGRLDWISIVAERRIEEAIEQGVFDNLPGKGKPLVFDDDALTPAHMRIVHKVLHNARVVPTWISLEQDIDNAKSEAERLREAWFAKPTWDIDSLRGARADYLSLMKRANDLILQFNVASPFVHRGPIPFRIKARLAEWDSRLGASDAAPVCAGASSTP